MPNSVIKQILGNSFIVTDKKKKQVRVIVAAILLCYLQFDSFVYSVKFYLDF